MTVKKLYGDYAGGYTLAFVNTGLIIESSASVGGTGVVSTHSATIENYGTVTSTGKGISLTAGGTIDNSGQIFASTGVSVGGTAGTVRNSANIQGGALGVSLAAGGSFTNENAATVYGKTAVSISGGVGTVNNYGSINSNTQGVTLTAGGLVENQDTGDIEATIGVGISGGVGTVENYGTIKGVNLYAGGSVVQGASLGAQIDHGVYIQGGAGTVTNVGEIKDGKRNDAIKLVGGGSVTNGEAALPFGTILSKVIGVYAGAVATVTNFATIIAVGEQGVTLKAGGVVANGTVNDAEALIEGGLAGVAIASASASITNFGRIKSTYGTTTAHGVILYDGGVVTNGGVTDQDASIAGYTGLYVKGAAGTVTNFATIRGTGVAPGNGTAGNYVDAAGVILNDGGVLTNGGLSDRAALISGFYFGVDAEALATVDNFGTIESTEAVRANGPNGVSFSGGGTLVNGGLSDQAALVLGYDGFNAGHDAAATVVNFGTIEGEGVAKSAGAILGDGGVITNGAVEDTRALITGYVGVYLVTAASVTNFATIHGEGAKYAAVDLKAGGVVANGSAKDAKAVIDGYVGVNATGAATVTNYGVIAGDGGVAVQFHASTDELIEEAGSSLAGVANGGGGALLLASGVGTLTSLGAGGEVQATSGAPLSTFVGFGLIEIGAAATFTALGSGVISAGDTLENAGTLTLGPLQVPGLLSPGGGTIANAGVLEAVGGVFTVNDAVSGAGTARIAAGRLDFTSTFTQNVTFAAGSTGTLELSKSQGYTGAITGFSKTGATALDLGDILFADAPTWTYSGSASSGVLTVKDTAGHTAKIHLVGDYLTSHFVLSAGPDDGTKVVDPTTTPPAVATRPMTTAAAPTHAFVQASAGMAGDGGAHLLARDGALSFSVPMLAASRHSAA